MGLVRAAAHAWTWPLNTTSTLASLNIPSIAARISAPSLIGWWWFDVYLPIHTHRDT